MSDGLRFAIGPCARAFFSLEQRSCAKAFITLVSLPTNCSRGIFAVNFESRAMRRRDRKSVVKGKSVDLGGRRISKKKKKKRKKKKQRYKKKKNQKRAKKKKRKKK